MKLMIVEDNSITLQSLTALLKGEPTIEIAGGFSTAEKALAGLSGCAPDILLVDLDLPGMSGLDLIKEVRQQKAGVEIMVYTVFEDRQSVFDALKAGASGYIVKSCTPRELIEALHALHAGGAPMSPNIARKVIREFQDAGAPEQELLTPREVDLLKLIEKGKTYKAIAETLSISPNTVHSHIKHIYGKLQAKDRSTALITARRKGIL